MSPAWASSTFLTSLPTTLAILPRRSGLPVEALSRLPSGLMVPEITRANEVRPACWSMVVLKMKAAAGASVDAGRSASVFLPGTTPLKGAWAVGGGTSSTMASRRAATPLGRTPDAK